MDRTIRAVALLMVLALGACSKKGETSTVTLAFPKWPSKASLSKSGSGPVALSTYENIQIIVVNISGPGMSAPALFAWDRHERQVAPPSSVSLTVPRGSDRLVQVLVVFEDGEAMEFHYGDSLAAINADDQAVAVTVNMIGGVSGQGTIAGRYLRADGTGPTGPVEVRFQPPNGRPSMVVGKEFIISGWFQFFALPTSGFSYRFMPTGTDFFTNYGTADAVPAGTQQAKLYVPSYWYHDEWSNGLPSGPRRKSAAQTSIFGFFSPGAAGKSVCFSSVAGPISDAYANEAVGDSTPVVWAANLLGDGEAGILAGGTTACGTAADEFVTHAKIDETQVTRHDGVLGFRGPFHLQPAGGSGNFRTEILGSTSGLNVVLAWKYVPGATDNGGVRGSRVYYRFGQPSPDGGDTDYERGDGISCQELSALPAPFAFLKDESAALGATSGSATIPATATQISEFKAGRFQAVVCPYIVDNGGVQQLIPRGGVDFRSHRDIMPTTLVAFKREAGVYGETTAGSPMTARQGSCVPMEIVAVDTFGNPGPTSGSTTITVNTPAAGETVSTSADCSSDGEATSIMGFRGRAYVYLKDNGASGAKTITMTAFNGTPLSDGAGYVNFVGPAAASAILTYSQPNAKAYECIPILYRSETGGIATGLSSNVTITFPAGAGWTHYTDGHCGTSGTSDPMGGGTGAAQRVTSARYTGAGSGTFTVSPTALTSELSAAAATITSATINITQPNPATGLAWMGLPPILTTGSCYPAHISLQDAGNQPTPNRPGYVTPGPQMDISANITNGTFHTSAGCGDAGVTSLTTSINQYDSYSNTMIYVKPTGGSLTLSGNATNLAAGVTIAGANFSTAFVGAAVLNILRPPRAWALSPTPMFSASPAFLAGTATGWHSSGMIRHAVPVPEGSRCRRLDVVPAAALSFEARRIMTGPIRTRRTRPQMQT